LTGILADTNANRSFDPTYFEFLFDIEERHFWFRTRNRIISALVGQITASLEPGYRVLEVGCGTGNVLNVLEQACPNGIVVGMDLFIEGLQYARRRTSCPLVQGDMGRPPFNKQFDLIGLFDVLEHLPDDMQVLRNLNGMLVSGGALFITVPAHPSLWSYFDEASHHCRRYKTAELESKLIRAGYRVEYMTQFMMSIYPLVWTGRRLASLRKDVRLSDVDSMHVLASQELRIIPVVNELLGWLLERESLSIARRKRLPIGTSLLAIARKNTPP